MIALSIRARAAIPAAVKVLLGGEADHPTDALRQVSPDLGPAERADAALVVEQVVAKAEELEGSR